MNDTGPPKPERSQGVSFYLGVAQLGEWGIWDAQVVGSSPTT